MARLAMLALALVVAALAQSAAASDPCRNVVCPTRDQYFADNCDANCDVIRIVTKRKNNDDGCCPVYKCVTNPDDPCCGRSCAANTLAEATEQCNEIFPDDPIMTNLSVEAGAQFAVLLREARPNKGKCCNKYECRTDANILCDNKNAKEPCENAAKCPKCFDAVTTVPRNAAIGQCCPEITCEPDFDCLCMDVNCPVPTCDPELEYAVQLFEANPEEGRCCPTLACQQNNTAICLAERESNPARLNATCADSCQVPLLRREANFERLSCFPEFECVDDPGQPCCRVDTADCDPEPNCQLLFGACGVLETRPADPFNGQCCDRFRCSQNVTCICEQSTCETVSEYEARKCDPREEEAYIKKPASPSEGLCCPKIRCRLTPEAKLRKLQKELKEQRQNNRRRRRNAATTDEPASSAVTTDSP